MSEAKAADKPPLSNKLNCVFEAAGRRKKGSKTGDGYKPRSVVQVCSPCRCGPRPKPTDGRCFEVPGPSPPGAEKKKGSRP